MSARPNWKMLEQERQRAAQRQYDANVGDGDREAELEKDYRRDFSRRVNLARTTGNFAAYLTDEERQEMADRRYDV